MSSIDDNQFLTFNCGEEVFAIKILGMKEIKEYSNITFVPMMPVSVRGVMNLRGNVLPIVDLNLRFGRDKTIPTKKTCIIVVETKQNEDKIDVGILVDSVKEVVDIPATEIEKPPGLGAKIRNDFISGIGKVGDEFVILLDVNKVLSVEELSQLEEKIAT
ncbi:MAG: chemotaxis protein CheW [Leptospiraceae bacterium]|nr:chemotaxis protein CheW [Leptospiraceae bacterium]